MNFSCIFNRILTWSWNIILSLVAVRIYTIYQFGSYGVIRNFKEIIKQANHIYTQNIRQKVHIICNKHIVLETLTKKETLYAPTLVVYPIGSSFLGGREKIMTKQIPCLLQLSTFVGHIRKIDMSIATTCVKNRIQPDLSRSPEKANQNSQSILVTNCMIEGKKSMMAIFFFWSEDVGDQKNQFCTLKEE